MLLSTQTAALQNAFGFEEAVRIIHEAGFDCYDFSMTRMGWEGHPLQRADYQESVKALRRYADSIGIPCNQSHAPFPMHRPDDDAWNKNIHEWCVRSLEITALLGGKICVVHPYNNWTPEENRDRVYLPLLPYCKKYGVKIAVENMWNWPAESPVAVPCACSLPENFCAHMDLLDPEWFVACLDIGHAEMFPDKTSAVQLIHALGDRLQCLHVHDNDRLHDDHGIPFTGKIEWDGVCAALKAIGYKGDFTFEADTAINKYPDPLKADAEKFLQKTGRYLINRIG